MLMESKAKTSCSPMWYTTRCASSRSHSRSATSFIQLLFTLVRRSSGTPLQKDTRPPSNRVGAPQTNTNSPIAAHRSTRLHAACDNGAGDQHAVGCLAIRIVALQLVLLRVLHRFEAQAHRVTPLQLRKMARPRSSLLPDRHTPARRPGLSLCMLSSGTGSNGR